MGATPYDPTIAGDAMAEEPTLGKLFIDAKSDTTSLIKDELALAKIELRDDAKNAVKGGAMFGVAGFLGLLATILLSFALVYLVHALGLPLGWSFLVVAVLYLLLAGVLALIGKRVVTKVKGPQRTIRTSKETVAELKRRRAAASGGDSGEDGPGVRERLDAAKAQASAQVKARLTQSREQLSETATRLTEPGKPLAGAKEWGAKVAARTPLSGSGTRRTVRSTTWTSGTVGTGGTAATTSGGATVMSATDFDTPPASRPLTGDAGAADERV